MKLIRCNNGHFYDQDKFGSCPYCNGGDSASDSMTEAFTTDSVTTPLRQPQQPAGAGMQSGTVPPQPFQPEIGVTISKPEAVVSKSLEQALSQVGPTMPLSQVNAINQQPGAGVQNNPVAQSDLSNIANSIGSQTPMSQINHMFSASSEDEDYTVAITPGGKKMGEGGLKPVVGWLVCLTGKHIGKDFRIVQGKNYIGRDGSMDICLEGEKTVSRDKHALIVYEPKHHLYLIQSGESKELTYVNDKVILESKELNAYDKILVGDVKLLFVPLCSDKFNWTDVLEGKDKDGTDEE